MAEHVAIEVAAQVEAWAESGAMALTGRRQRRPLGPPAGLVDRVGDLGKTLGVDALALLGERAAIAGLERNGEVSCGGACRLLRATDGWVALSLARPDDVELVPALLQRDLGQDDPWGAIRSDLASVTAEQFAGRARLLGLPAAALSDHSEPVGGALPASMHPVEGPSSAPLAIDQARVADLSSLWAGPLCGAFLVSAGAEVLKVESSGRPDGARAGPRTFFDLMNGGKAGVALDLRSRDGVVQLVELLRSVDVVIEASRPRALEQMGIDRRALVGGGGPRVWLSITGYGRQPPIRDWVAFGDDAAVAGGLVVWDDDGPCFCADAVADPLAGTVAAVAVLDALARGGRWLIDVSLAEAAAWCRGPTLAVADAVTASEPRSRSPREPGPRLGEHTAAVLASIRR